MVVRIMKVLVADNVWYIGILNEYENTLTLVDSSCFVHVLVRRKLYEGWVGWLPANAKLVVEPEVYKYHDIIRIGRNLYILDRESEITPEIEGLDRYYV